MEAIRRTGLAMLCVLLLRAVPVGAAPMAPALPDHAWLLDDGSGATAAPWTGGEIGVFRGAPGWDGDSAFGGAGNGSLRFAGGDALEMPGLATSLNGLPAFTLSMWIRSDGVAADRGFFSGQQLEGGGNTRGQDLFGARYDASGWLSTGQGLSTSNLLKLGITLDQGGVAGSYQLESSEGLQTTGWQHVLVIFESGVGLQLYVDGVLDTPTQDQTAGQAGEVAGQAGFTLGDGTKAGWSGLVDETALWTRALSGQEAAWLASNPLVALAEPAPFWLLGLAGLAAAGRRRPRRPRAS